MTIEFVDVDPCLAKGRFLGWDRHAANWVCQPKKDGWREVSQIIDGRVHMTGRKRDIFGDLIERGQNLHHIRTAPAALNGAIFDGEVYLPGGVGSDVGSIMACHRPEDAIKKYANKEPHLWPRYMIFDIIALPGRKYVTHLSYRERLNLLRQLEIKGHFLEWSGDHVHLVWSMLNPEEDCARYIADGGEGVVLKDLRSRYVYGVCGSWVKVVPKKTGTVLCSGMQRGEGKYAHTLGALDFFGHIEGHKVWGSCGGMTDAQRDDMWKNWEKYKGAAFDVEYKRITPGKALISANFVRWREDL
jgi:ATP-dependent DNA ligase